MSKFQMILKYKHAELLGQVPEVSLLTKINPVICDGFDYDELFQLIHNEGEDWMVEFSDEDFESEHGSIEDMTELFLEHCKQYGEMPSNEDGKEYSNRQNLDSYQ